MRILYRALPARLFNCGVDGAEGSFNGFLLASHGRISQLSSGVSRSLVQNHLQRPGRVERAVDIADAFPANGAAFIENV